MNPAISKFVHEIINDILLLHDPENNRFSLGNERTFRHKPVLYSKFGRNLVRYYFACHKESAKTFCSEVSKKLKKTNFDIRVDSLLEFSRNYDGDPEAFYSLCIKLTLFGLVGRKKGIGEALSIVAEKISALANEAHNRGDLNEKFDCMFNFAYDLLTHVHEWYGCDTSLQWDLKKLDLDSNVPNYFSMNQSYFDDLIRRNGNSILNKFDADEGLNLESMPREVFIFRIQEWCDSYYGQLDRLEKLELFKKFLEICVNISLFSVHAVKLHFPCCIRLAHESLMKLAISAESHHLFSSDIRAVHKVKEDLLEF